MNVFAFSEGLKFELDQMEAEMKKKPFNLILLTSVTCALVSLGSPEAQALGLVKVNQKAAKRTLSSRQSSVCRICTSEK